MTHGDVTVAVDYSTVNYKDALAITGKAPVVRRFPMIAGIDFAGTVEQSSHPQWKAGDKVILRRSNYEAMLLENPEAREWRSLAEKLNWAASPRYAKFEP